MKKERKIVHSGQKNIKAEAMQNKEEQSNKKTEESTFQGNI